MTNRGKPFELTPTERAALQSAAADFLAWQRLRGVTMRPRSAERLARLGAAVRAVVRALDDLQRTPERAELLARMQEQEGWRFTQSHYSDALQAVEAPLHLAERACRSLVRRGREPDHRAHEWVRCAALHWRSAGLPVSASGRFSRALAEAPPEVPSAPDRDVIRAALK